jgi:hypothetical protein
VHAAGAKCRSKRQAAARQCERTGLGVYRHAVGRTQWGVELKKKGRNERASEGGEEEEEEGGEKGTLFCSLLLQFVASTHS